MQQEYRIDRPLINGKRSKTWYICWTDNGRSKRVSTRKTDYALAEQVAAQFFSALNAPPAEFTVKDLCDAYEEERIESGKTSQSHHLKAVTRILGNLTPETLSRERVRMFHRTRRSEGVTDSTINRQCRTLRAALNWGAKEGWIKKVPYIAAPQAAGARDRFLTYEEVYKILGAAKAPHLRTFIALAIWTGARMGALLELTWDMIDEERMLIFWPKGTANKRRPVVTPINEPLGLALSVAAFIGDSEYVVSWNGKQIDTPRRAFSRAADAAGVEDVTIHDMRRTAASWLLQAGGTFEEAAALLEDDIRTVQKHYGRFALDNMRAITDRIASAHNGRAYKNPVGTEIKNDQPVQGFSKRNQ